MPTSQETTPLRPWTIYCDIPYSRSKSKKGLLHICWKTFRAAALLYH